jgi:hypothetical protein
MEELKDIKQFEFISVDFTSYIIVALVIFLLASIVIISFTFWKKSRKLSSIAQAIKNLKNLDFSKSSKEVAYEFTINGYICVEQTNQDEFFKILKLLERYKYKKQVDDLDDEIIEDMKDFIRVRL